MSRVSDSQPLARYADLSPVPWANGSGTTVEMIALAASADFAPGLPPWKLSVASLERPALFSPLPGLHRRFMPVGGDVTLDIDGRPTPVAEGEVCAFEGDQVVALTRLPRPCNAVNLMIEGPPLLRLRRVPTGEPLPGGALVAIMLEAASGLERFDLLRLPPIEDVGGNPAVRPVVLDGPCAVVERGPVERAEDRGGF